MTEREIYLPPFAYEPLTAFDRELLAKWGYAEDHPLARSTVRVGRLQRWLVSCGYPLDHIDGKLGPCTFAVLDRLSLDSGCLTLSGEEIQILQDYQSKRAAEHEIARLRERLGP
jgi:hypothetical protein